MLAPVRVHQTTTTMGTGTYSLTNATGRSRNFKSIYSSGNPVPYCVTDNVSNYEIGIGTLTTGSPDTISRSTILLSSNGNAAVNWGNGTKDIFAYEVGISCYLIDFSTNHIASLTDWGNAYIFTGGVTKTLTLPALGSVPSGFTLTLKNSGTVDCNLAPGSGDQIESLSVGASDVLVPGAFRTVGSDGSVWREILVGVGISPEQLPFSQVTNLLPTGTNSAVYKMMGLGVSITPLFTGRIKIDVYGDAYSAVAGDGGQIQTMVGTGTAPSNGATITGTGVGGAIEFIPAANSRLPFHLTSIVTSLSLNVPLWIDLALSSIISSTLVTVENVSVVAVEF